MGGAVVGVAKQRRSMSLSDSSPSSSGDMSELPQPPNVTGNIETPSGGDFVETQPEGAPLPGGFKVGDEVCSLCERVVQSQDKPRKLKVGSRGTVTESIKAM